MMSKQQKRNGKKTEKTCVLSIKHKAICNINVDINTNNNINNNYDSNDDNNNNDSNDDNDIDNDIDNDDDNDDNNNDDWRRGKRGEAWRRPGSAPTQSRAGRRLELRTPRGLLV